MNNKDYIAFELILFAIILWFAVSGTSSCGSLPPASEVDSMFHTSIEDSGMYLKSVDTKMFQSTVYTFVGSIDNKDSGAFALSKQEHVIETKMIPEGEHWKVVKEIPTEISGHAAKITLLEMGNFSEDETDGEACGQASHVLVSTQDTNGYYGLWLEASLPNACDFDALKELEESRITPFFETYVFHEGNS